MHKNLVMVVPGYYEAKKKERVVRSSQQSKPTPSKHGETRGIPVPPMHGGAHGDDTLESQTQNLDIKDFVGSITDVSNLNVLICIQLWGIS